MLELIGIFDSGIGGLTVLREIHKLLPKESTVYLGDTARVPYGIRSPETVVRYSLENASFLVNKGIKLLVIACNTASAISLNAIKDAFSIPVIGVIQPGAVASVNSTKTKRIGVIGTETTVKSGSYSTAIHNIDSNIEVFEKSCPLFVPLAEEGWLDNEITEAIAFKYLKDLKEYSIDTLVLGCTHYPLLKETIKKVMGEDISLIDSAIETAKIVKDTLIDSFFLNEDHNNVIRQYYVTDMPDRFIKIGRGFLSEPIDNIETINITSLELSY